jgi:hypothetical protein
MIMSRIIAILIVLYSSTAFAQSATAQAEALFRQGRDLMTAGKVAEACSAFQESQKLEPAVSTLINLAACREKLGQLATAWGMMLDAVRQTRSSTDATGQRLHQIARDRAQRLEPRISKLTISVPAQRRIDGLEILRDAERVGDGLWNRALPIDGGTYAITARLHGTTRWSTRVTVAAERDHQVVEIPDLGSVPGQGRPASDPGGPASAQGHAGLDARSRSGNVAPLVLGAGALALLGGGIGFEVSARSRYDDYKAAPASSEDEAAHKESLYASANTRRYVADALIAGGIVTGGVAIWLYLRGRDREPGAATSVQVIPRIDGLAVLGRF